MKVFLFVCLTSMCFRGMFHVYFLLVNGKDDENFYMQESANASVSFNSYANVFRLTKHVPRFCFLFSIFRFEVEVGQSIPGTLLGLSFIFNLFLQIYYLAECVLVQFECDTVLKFNIVREAFEVLCCAHHGHLSKRF